MPKCPSLKCGSEFHPGAEECPYCGYSLDMMERFFKQEGVTVSFPFSRVTDRAGELTRAETARIEAALAKLERKIQPVALAVFLPNMGIPFRQMDYSFCCLNNISVMQAGFKGRTEPVKPEWLFVLVLDVRAGTAHFMWGYQLDPYVKIDAINNAIHKQRYVLKDRMLAPAVRKIMKHAVKSIASSGRSVARRRLGFFHALTAPWKKNSTPTILAPITGGTEVKPATRGKDTES